MTFFQVWFWGVLLLGIAVYASISAILQERRFQRRYEIEEQLRRERWLREERAWRSRFE